MIAVNIFFRERQTMQKKSDPYKPPFSSGRERDYRLAQDALYGNEDAWDTLYQDSHGYVINAAKNFDCQRLFCACDYEDIADEAFAKCHEQLERYQGLSRFRNWVAGYAKNIMRNRRRRQLTARRNRYLLENIAESQFRRLDPLLVLIRLERDQFLWEAFYQLTASEQTILYERIFFNTPPRALAKDLNLTKRQVLEHYETARFKVRWQFLRLYRRSQKTSLD